MKDSYSPMAFLYRGALVIYPRRLRAQYCEQMLQTLHDAYRDRPAGALRFWLHAFHDLLQFGFNSYDICACGFQGEPIIVANSNWLQLAMSAINLCSAKWNTKVLKKTLVQRILAASVVFVLNSNAFECHTTERRQL